MALGALGCRDGGLAQGGKGPKRPKGTWDHDGNREERKHLFLNFRMELKMGIGLGIT